MQAVESEYINVYPNPTDGQITIALSETYEDVLITVYSLNGEEIFTRSFFNNQPISLELEAPQGLYVLKVVSERSVASFKILKT